MNPTPLKYLQRHANCSVTHKHELLIIYYSYRQGSLASEID